MSVSAIVIYFFGAALGSLGAMKTKGDNGLMMKMAGEGVENGEYSPPHKVAFIPQIGIAAFNTEIEIVVIDNNKAAPHIFDMFSKYDFI